MIIFLLYYYQILNQDADLSLIERLLKVEDFLEKHHIPIKEAKKMFKDKENSLHNDKELINNIKEVNQKNIIPKESLWK